MQEVYDNLHVFECILSCVPEGNPSLKHLKETYIRLKTFAEHLAQLYAAHSINSQPRAYEDPVVRRLVWKFGLWRVNKTILLGDEPLADDEDSEDYDVHEFKRMTLPMTGPKIFDYKHETGLEKVVVDKITKLVYEVRIRDGKKRINRKRSRLCTIMTLYWLKKASTLQEVANSFKVPLSSAHRIIHEFLIYIVAATSHFIPKPQDWRKGARIDTIRQASGVELECIGAIDCTTCYRNRVHPGSYRFYRGDHGKHAVTVQVLVDFHGRILDVVVANGHMTDWSLFGAAGMIDVLQENHLGVLADLGYMDSPVTVVPESLARNQRMTSKYNIAHAAARAKIEIVNAHIKKWWVLDTKFRLSPQLQALAILAISNIYNMDLCHTSEEESSHRELIAKTRGSKHEDLVQGPKKRHGRATNNSATMPMIHGKN